MGITGMWDQLVNCICRPPRDSEYTVEDLVGGAAGRFALPGYKGYTARRQDLTLTNKSGLTLQCSHYIPEKVEGRDGRLPCVIYCHCNSGSRRDCEEALFQLLPLGISVFALDFAGSGLSEGNWVTLGAHEVDDVQVAVDYLRGTEAVSTLGLWGRSMGAVTALLYSQRDPSIAGMVLDSPFSSLTDLMLEIVEEQQLPVPKVAMKVALSAMKWSVKKRAGFDLSEVTPLTVVPQSFIPALFGHATGDTFIKITHTHKLHAAYAGDKNLITVPGDHNSPRPPFFKSSVAIFFTNVLQLERMIVGGNSSYLQHNREFDAAAQAAAVAAAPSRGAGRPGAAQAWAVHLDPIAVDTAATIPRLPVSTSPRQDAEEDAFPPMLQRNGLVAAPTPEEGIDELLAREQDEDNEADMVRAIEASLQDQATQVHRQGAGHASATRAVVVPVPAAPRTPPITATASDDELLQAAIALSLAEASSHHVNAAAARPVEGPEKSDDSYVDLLVRELGGGLATPAQAAAK